MVGQQTSPSSHGASVPEMQSQPASRQPPWLQSPSCPQNPEQQPAQVVPQAHDAGQTTASPLHNPPKHWLGGTQVPRPPGWSGLSAQQTSPGMQAFGVPGRQWQPSSAQGRICADALISLNPTAARTPATADCPSRRNVCRRDCRPANWRVRRSNWLCSTMSLLRSGARSQVATPARAAGRAIVAPVARRATTSARPHARATAVARQRADASAAGHPGGGWAADQAIVARVPRSGRATAADIVAIEAGPRPDRERRRQRRTGKRGRTPQEAASRPAVRHRSGHRIEPLAIHPAAPVQALPSSVGAGTVAGITVTRKRRAGSPVRPPHQVSPGCASRAAAETRPACRRLPPPASAAGRSACPGSHPATTQPAACRC